MRWLVPLVVLAACTTEDPTQLRTGATLRKRTNNAPAVQATDLPKTASIAEKCVNIINQYRATKGLDPYDRWDAQEDCSDGEAKSDSKSGKAHGAFQTCTETAQNECPNYPGDLDENLPECLADMWAEGPGGGHYDNMTDTSRTKVACGVYELSNGNFWAVQNFK